MGISLFRMMQSTGHTQHWFFIRSPLFGMYSGITNFAHHGQFL
jgi:hypothetical protein